MRLNEHVTIENLGSGQHRLIYQRGHNYWDRDEQSYVATPADLVADDRSAGFSHVHKGRSWKRLARGGRHRVGFGIGQDVTYLPVGAADVAPEIAGNVALYRNLWPATVAELQVSPEGVKETLTLSDQSAPRTFVWDAQTRGCIFSHGEYVEVLTGRVIGRLEEITAVDAAGAPVPVDVTYGTTLTITVQPTAETVWPVTVDPTTTIQPDGAAGVDTYIDSANPTTNYGTATTLPLASTTTRFPLLRFDLSAIPANVVILSADLSVTHPSEGSSSVNMTIQPITSDWVEAQATWNLRKTGVAWNATWGASTGDYATGVTVSGVSWVSAVTAATFSVLSLVQGWLSGAVTNYGLRLTNPNYGLNIYSSDHATVSYRPKLEVVWTAPPTPTSPTGTSGAPGIVRDSVAPRLSWSNVAGITPTKLQVQVADLSDNILQDSGQVSSTSSYYDVTGAAGLKYGVLYKWRVQVYDGASWSGYSAWQYFVCLPAPPVGLTVTPDAANAQIGLSWAASPAVGLAGYGVMRKGRGAADSTAIPLNLTAITGTSYADDIPVCGRAYEYAVYCITTDGCKGQNSDWVQGVVTFVGARFGDLVVLNRVPPVPQHNRRASKRMQTDGTYLIQARGFGPKDLTLQLGFRTLAEHDAIMARITDAPVPYRDDRGNAIRGICVASPAEQVLDVARKYMGYLTIVITEVIAR